MVFVSYEYFQIMIVKSVEVIWSDYQTSCPGKGGTGGMETPWDTDQSEDPNIAICGGEGGEEEGRVQLQLWLQLLQLWWRLQLQPLSDDIGFGLFN